MSDAVYPHVKYLEHCLQLGHSPTIPVRDLPVVIAALQAYVPTSTLETKDVPEPQSRVEESPADVDSGWISVEDRLPEPFREVITWNGVIQALAKWEAGEFYSTWDCDSILSVTHWQPLPKPPTPKAQGPTLSEAPKLSKTDEQGGLPDGS